MEEPIRFNGVPKVTVEPHGPDESYWLHVDDVTRWLVERSLREFQALHKTLKAEYGDRVPALSRDTIAWPLFRSARDRSRGLSAFLERVLSAEDMRESLAWPPAGGAKWYLRARAVQGAGLPAATMVAMAVGDEVSVSAVCKQQPPMWNHSNDFAIKAQEGTGTLRVSVWHKRLIMNDVCVGVAAIDIAKLMKNTTHDLWVPLQQRAAGQPGCVHVVLYLTDKERDPIEDFVIINKDDADEAQAPRERAPAAPVMDQVQEKLFLEFLEKLSVCSVCSRKSKPEAMLSLECGHNFCFDCLRHHYKEYLNSRHCRFCGKTVTASDADCNVCDDEECAEKNRAACQKRHPASDYCNICWVEELGAAPCIQLTCGHVLHYHCLRQRLERGWQSPFISFGFMTCPLCNKQIEHTALDSILKPMLQLKSEVESRAAQRLEYEGFTKAKEITSPESPFFQKPLEFAMHRYLYSLCHKCRKPYFAGVRQCQAGVAADDNIDPVQLTCDVCAGIGVASDCSIHGKEYIEYKCRYCCSVAAWYCGPSLGHFCNACHTKQCAGDYLNRKPVSALPQCPGPESCQLKIPHPQPGVDFSLGCIICRNLKTF
eukprot:m51a1_g6672 putative probable e3 ubiquitin-protein ligase mycbp2 (598) ;mRNA; r:204452-207534